jgi:membrane-bound lytic murein transglycosylase D
MRVSQKEDERLDVMKETEAALRYLSDLHREFHDWLLAVKAYNEGEKQVRRLVDREKTADPWHLESVWSQDNYLSSMMAALILWKNPQLLD